MDRDSHEVIRARGGGGEEDLEQILWIPTSFPPVQESCNMTVLVNQYIAGSQISMSEDNLMTILESVFRIVT
ncbi:hypothetical protein ACJ72_06763 [Emergomyces africanus]|uniref:Uncharacterized protein n=1 Tax=Emergomyces africanus TaxID=1955775 RepID=A0A1B7NQ09_9EURO|nr:hypothetical protein ACJ72_06763 [Emergomyces africanus]